ncbi:hypothetical protein NOSIN_00400 [Nocardiopsis sinuspersici]|uniref:DUF3307 domain-containing protein n=1 Tax=Nocardiopsis sinuspersici TaxID=501010 RepID=A0A1V3BVF9_9ACTN|nr:hypothetical protein NOSIN_00400 [Nocardiopsis sinuspersici]
MIYAALLSGHWVGDHWAQTDHQATTKGERTRTGRQVCAAHVATLTLCQMVALALVVVSEGGFAPVQAALGLAVNAATHYWADRRRTLEGLAHLLGKHGYYTRGGAPHLDLAWHMGWMLPAALIISADLVPALALSGLCLVLLLLADQLSRLGWNEARRSTVRS